jgi:hypothetical protein
MPAEKRRYLAYLLRLWQIQRNDEMVWIASLEDAHTHERHSFIELEPLITFLRQQIQMEEYNETLID